MGYAIGTVTKDGGLNTHYQLLGVIKTLLETNGWTTLRYDTSTDNHELILQGEGLSSTEEIFIGFKTYQSITSDYYNIAVACFTGYVSANTFEMQPNAKISGVPAHNNAITYFIQCNAQQVTGCLKVGTPVYEHFGVGKFFPYGRPGEYPSPLYVAGMFDGAEAKRFSDTGQTFPWGGSGYSTNCMLWIRKFDGTWSKTYNYPFSKGSASSGSWVYCLAGPVGTSTLIPAGSTYEYYQIEPIVMQDVTSLNNIWGELESIYFCSGFNNGTENVLQIGGSSIVDQSGMTVLQAVDAIIAVSGRAFVICQDVYRTTWRNYIAMEMK